MIEFSTNLQNLQTVPIQARPFYNNKMEDIFMSRRHHALQAAQSHAVLTNLHEMDYDQMHDIYGIDIAPEGAVYDETYNRRFKSLSEWADWCVANDEYETYEAIRGHRYDALT
jgi:hypothetical protein